MAQSHRHALCIVPSRHASVVQPVSLYLTPMEQSPAYCWWQPGRVLIVICMVGVGRAGALHCACVCAQGVGPADKARQALTDAECLSGGGGLACLPRVCEGALSCAPALMQASVCARALVCVPVGAVPVQPHALFNHCTPLSGWCFVVCGCCLVEKAGPPCACFTAGGLFASVATCPTAACVLAQGLWVQQSWHLVLAALRGSCACGGCLALWLPSCRQQSWLGQHGTPCETVEYSHRWLAGVWMVSLGVSWPQPLLLKVVCGSASSLLWLSQQFAGDVVPRVRFWGPRQSSTAVRLPRYHGRAPSAQAHLCLHVPH